MRYVLRHPPLIGTAMVLVTLLSIMGWLGHIGASNPVPPAGPASYKASWFSGTGEALMVAKREMPVVLSALGSVEGGDALRASAGRISAVAAREAERAGVNERAAWLEVVAAAENLVTTAVPGDQGQSWRPPYERLRSAVLNLPR
jgi:hypothetical protein